MIVQHLKYPFDHTILYDVFHNHEISQILEDKNKLLCEGDASKFVNDPHHINLIQNQKVKSYNVDSLIPNSSIRKYSLKIFECAKMGVFGFDNLFLQYFHICKPCDTYVNIYNNESYYSKHHDGSLLTALYIFWDGFGNKNGGDLYFPDYEYFPHMRHNSCIIFPSIVFHEVTKLMCDDSLSRVSINQRFLI